MYVEISRTWEDGDMAVLGPALMLERSEVWQGYGYFPTKYKYTLSLNLGLGPWTVSFVAVWGGLS
jgi:hypothetical protein